MEETPAGHQTAADATIDDEDEDERFFTVVLSAEERETLEHAMRYMEERLQHEHDWTEAEIENARARYQSAAGSLYWADEVR